MVQHGVTVHEAITRRRFAKRHRGAGEAPVGCGEGHAEFPTGLDARSGATDRHGASLVNGAQLLRVALEIAAHQREILVDPDEDTATVELAVIATTHDDERLLVLRAHRIHQLFAVVTTT